MVNKYIWTFIWNMYCVSTGYSVSDNVSKYTLWQKCTCEFLLIAILTFPNYYYYIQGPGNNFNDIETPSIDKNPNQRKAE